MIFNWCLAFFPYFWLFVAFLSSVVFYFLCYLQHKKHKGTGDAGHPLWFLGAAVSVLALPFLLIWCAVFYFYTSGEDDLAANYIENVSCSLITSDYPSYIAIKKDGVTRFPFANYPKAYFTYLEMQRKAKDLKTKQRFELIRQDFNNSKGKNK